MKTLVLGGSVSDLENRLQSFSKNIHKKEYI